MDEWLGFQIDTVEAKIQKQPQFEEKENYGGGARACGAVEREHFWLTVVPPEHFAHYSIYRS